MNIETKLIKVGSEEDLETGVVTFKLGIQLPTGDVVYADASDEVILKLRQHVTAAPAVSASSVVTAPLTPSPIVEELEGAALAEEPVLTSPPENVKWEEIPDLILPERVKVAMRAFVMGDGRLPSELDMQQVIQIRDAILSEYTDDDWAQLGVASVGAEEYPEVVHQVGVVSWEDGSPRQPGQRFQRTVSRVDDRGNPIVKQNIPPVVERDPGEIVADDDDDETSQF